MPQPAMFRTSSALDDVLYVTRCIERSIEVPCCKRARNYPLLMERLDSRSVPEVTRWNPPEREYAETWRARRSERAGRGFPAVKLVFRRGASGHSGADINEAPRQERREEANYSPPNALHVDLTLWVLTVLARQAALQDWGHP